MMPLFSCGDKPDLMVDSEPRAPPRWGSKLDLSMAPPWVEDLLHLDYDDEESLELLISDDEKDEVCILITSDNVSAHR